jgi:hypothetical protein
MYKEDPPFWRRLKLQGDWVPKGSEDFVIFRWNTKTKAFAATCGPYSYRQLYKLFASRIPSWIKKKTANIGIY